MPNVAFVLANRLAGQPPNTTLGFGCCPSGCQHGLVFLICSFEPYCNPVPAIIDPVFAKTSQNARFLLSENERFGLVFVKTGSINSGTDIITVSLAMAGSIYYGMSWQFEGKPTILLYY
jgi:hypothetical protein